MPVSASSSHKNDHPTFTSLMPYWQVTLAAFSGWFLDAFDQTALMFTLPDIAKDFGCSLAALGSVFLAQALGRAVGNTGWGWLSDRFGRKPAFTLGVLFFALFAALTGTTHHVLSLVIIQFLFGIGFGGEWTASATLLMESVPAPLRPLASATMMAGYEVGYMAAAGAQALILPHYGWRLMFFIGLLPALLIIFIRLGVKESPLWLAAQEEKKQHTPPTTAPKSKTSLWASIRLFWNGAAFQAVAFMCFLEFQKAALYTFYPTILRDHHHLSPQLIFWPVALYCLGSFSGKILCGALATRFGEARIMRLALLVVMLLVVPFLNAGPWIILLVSAFLIGAAASGVYALVPHYLSQRFPDARRSAGMGTSYAVGSLGQGVAGRVVPALGPIVSGLPIAATLCVLAGTIMSIGVTFFRPKDVQNF